MRLTQYRYVLVNTLASVVAFARNLMFMATLGLGDLGQVALMQTIVMLVGFIQFGTINGAFILFAEGRPEQTRRIATLLNTGVLALACGTGLLAFVGGGHLLEPAVAPATLILGVFAGLASLASTWMNNLLIAKGALDRSSLINIGAVTVSLVAAALSLPWGLPAALASMLLQPLVVATAALALEPETRPNGIRPDAATLKHIWSTGILQFLGGLSVLLTYQVERWTITFLLGNEDLGRFYLVMMFTTFFQLVPAALLNVHLPRAVRAVEARNGQRLRDVLRRHLTEILAYGGAILLAVLVLAAPTVRLLAPQFESGVALLPLAFPAMMIFVLRDNATLALFAARQMRPLLVSGVLLLSTYTILLSLAALMGQFSLESVVMLRGVAVTVSALYLFRSCRVALADRA